MPIILHKSPPAPSFEELKANLSGVHPDPDDQSPHIPHEVYNIGFDDLLAGNGFDAARLTAWRYIFRGDDGQNHVAEIGVDEAKNHAFHSVNMGNHVENFIALYDRVRPTFVQTHKHDTVQDLKYTINLLRAPACYVMAVWFQGADHDHDFFVPLAPVHGKFEAGRHYEADEFRNLLQEAARDMAVSAIDYSSTASVENKDDLTRIEGIGPKTADLLQAAGIATFAALANASPSQLQSILHAGGSRYNLADPATWPEQAALAAAGKWHELEKLKDELKGGRR